MSTPHGKRGFFYEAWNRGQNWTRISVKATDCPRISKAFLEEQRKSMGDRWYRQEYGCEFVESDDQLIRDDFIDRAIRADIEPLKFDWSFT